MVFNWGKKMVARHDEEEDMTMEEILASIRRYVADDKPVSQERPKVSEFKPSHEPEPITNTIVVEPDPDKAERQRRMDMGRDETIFELTEVIEDEAVDEVVEEVVEVIKTLEPTPPPAPQPTMAPTPMPTPPPASTTQPTMEVRPAEIRTSPIQPVAKERPMQQHPSDESMTSPQTMQASLSALSKLAEVKKTSDGSGSNALTLDRLVADLARPMIKEWLDKHLAGMVERMVAKEIERITKELQR